MVHNARHLVVFILALHASIAAAQSPHIRVGVWNIEVLSSTDKRGFPELQGDAALEPRSDDDLQAIAEYLRDEIEVDALMISEIDADAATSSPDSPPQSKQLDTIRDHLGSNWQYFLGKTGGEKRLGLLFNEDRIQLKKLVNLDADPFFVSGKDVFDRDPFVVWINALDNGQPMNDLLLVCLHLKSDQDPYRHNRMAAVAKVLGDIGDKDVRAALTLPNKREEREVLILGDCNDSSHTASGFKYMFDYLDGIGYSHLKPSSGPYPRTRVNGSQIDHIFASSTSMDSLVSNSFKVHTVPDTDNENAAYRKVFSDHFPVTVDIAVRPDDDATLREVLAMNDDGERARRLAQLRDDTSEEDEVEELPDDEDTEPIVVKAQIIDDNFESILAPRVSGTGRPPKDEESTGGPDAQ